MLSERDLIVLKLLDKKSLGVLDIAKKVSPAYSKSSIYIAVNELMMQKLIMKIDGKFMITQKGKEVIIKQQDLTDFLKG